MTCFYGTHFTFFCCVFITQSEKDLKWIAASALHGVPCVIDLMAFSHTGLRILAVEDMTISAHFITAHNLCLCALVRQSRSDLRLNILNAKVQRRIWGPVALLIIFLVQSNASVQHHSWFTPILLSTREKESEKKKQKPSESIAIYCNWVALHLLLVPLLNHAIVVWMSNVDKGLILGLKWPRSHL